MYHSDMTSVKTLAYRHVLLNDQLGKNFLQPFSKSKSHWGALTTKGDPKHSDLFQASALLSKNAP